ncbi:MAG: hypothetical protein DMG00_03415 [Acidobacteria bacterium]|nr:MAG: hypothetical protein DMG00_03415 [Acidobacteriota bacterium]
MDRVVRFVSLLNTFLQVLLDADAVRRGEHGREVPADERRVHRRQRLVRQRRLQQRRIFFDAAVLECEAAVDFRFHRAGDLVGDGGLERVDRFRQGRGREGADPEAFGDVLNQLLFGRRQRARRARDQRPDLRELRVEQAVHRSRDDFRLGGLDRGRDADGRTGVADLRLADEDSIRRSIVVAREGERELVVHRYRCRCLHAGVDSNANRRRSAQQAREAADFAREHVGPRHFDVRLQRARRADGERIARLQRSDAVDQRDQPRTLDIAWDCESDRLVDVVAAVVAQAHPFRRLDLTGGGAGVEIGGGARRCLNGVLEPRRPAREPDRRLVAADDAVGVFLAGGVEAVDARRRAGVDLERERHPLAERNRRRDRGRCEIEADSHVVQCRARPRHLRHDDFPLDDGRRDFSGHIAFSSESVELLRADPCPVAAARSYTKFTK